MYSGRTIWPAAPQATYLGETSQIPNGEDRMDYFRQVWLCVIYVCLNDYLLLLLHDLETAPWIVGTRGHGSILVQALTHPPPYHFAPVNPPLPCPAAPPHLCVPTMRLCENLSHTHACACVAGGVAPACGQDLARMGMVRVRQR